MRMKGFMASSPTKLFYISAGLRSLSRIQRGGGQDSDSIQSPTSLYRSFILRA